MLNGPVSEQVCHMTCENDVHCPGFYLTASKDCYRCADKDSDWGSAVCSRMQKPKGCTKNNECVLCGQDEDEEAMQKAAEGKWTDATMWLSPTCHHREQSPNAFLTKHAIFGAKERLAVYGPGTVESMTIAAKSVDIQNVNSNGAVRVSSVAISVDHLHFFDAYASNCSLEQRISNSSDENCFPDIDYKASPRSHPILIIHDVPEDMTATISNISSAAGPCAGIVNSRGTLEMDQCSCATTLHTLVIQQPLESPQLTLKLEGACDNAVDMTAEFNMFGTEYEIRFFNDGKYMIETNAFVAGLLLPSILAVVGLLILLPVCHAAAWKMLLTYLSKKHYQ